MTTTLALVWLLGQQLAPPPATIVIDHDSVTAAAFEAVSVAPVQALRVMSVDESVGWNISNGLQCLATGSAAARAVCRRWAWPDGSHAVPPMTWTAHPLPRWQFFTWPRQSAPDGSARLPCPDPGTQLGCFESFVDANADQWDVVSLQPTYTSAGSRIKVDAYLAMHERLVAKHPSLVIILHTANLARIIGTRENAEFNTAVRDHVREHGGVLIDIADIESHDPFGQPWDYNGYPVIAPHYTSEAKGGHLGSPSAGMIRLAEAWWIALGRIVEARTRPASSR